MKETGRTDDTRRATAVWSADLQAVQDVNTILIYTQLAERKKPRQHPFKRVLRALIKLAYTIQLVALSISDESQITQTVPSLFGLFFFAFFGKRTLSGCLGGHTIKVINKRNKQLSQSEEGRTTTQPPQKTRQTIKAG